MEFLACSKSKYYLSFFSARRVFRRAGTGVRDFFFLALTDSSHPLLCLVNPTLPPSFLAAEKRTLFYTKAHLWALGSSGCRGSRLPERQSNKTSLPESVSGERRVHFGSTMPTWMPMARHVSKPVCGGFATGWNTGWNAMQPK